jgi:hypothetical protein
LTFEGGYQSFPLCKTCQKTKKVSSSKSMANRRPDTPAAMNLLESMGGMRPPWYLRRFRTLCISLMP